MPARYIAAFLFSKFEADNISKIVPRWVATMKLDDILFGSQDQRFSEELLIESREVPANISKLQLQSLGRAVLLKLGWVELELFEDVQHLADFARKAKEQIVDL